MDKIQIHEFKKLNLKGATVIDGFPSVGLVSTIVANYIIKSLDLEQIGMVSSDYFPPLSIIRDGKPLTPVRIYAGRRLRRREELAKNGKIVVFISEFPPQPELIRPIASGILNWMLEKRCGLLISPEGFVSEKNKPQKGNFNISQEETHTFGIGSTSSIRKLLSEKEIPQFREGAITGVTGVLLNNGILRGFDVCCILAETHPNYPDARAAAKIIETINKLSLDVEINPKPLYEQAEEIEKQLRKLMEQAKPSMKQPAVIPQPQMYG